MENDNSFYKRVENGNSINPIGVLKVGGGEDDNLFLIGKSTLFTSINQLSSGILEFEVKNNFGEDNGYGNITTSSSFMRVHTNNIGKDFVDIKITKVITFDSTSTKLQGYVISGKREDVHIDDTVSFLFYLQDKAKDDYCPIDLFAGSITDTSAILSWYDSSPRKTAKYYQVMWRKIGTNVFEYSNVITGIIGKNIYNLNGLSSNSLYEWSVVSFFDDKRKTYSKYAPKLTFKTR